MTQHPTLEFAKLQLALSHAGSQLLIKVREIKAHHVEFGPAGIDAAIKRSIAPEIKQHLREMTAALELYERATFVAPRVTAEEYDAMVAREAGARRPPTSTAEAN